jgi:hypothetical protein
MIISKIIEENATYFEVNKIDLWVIFGTWIGQTKSFRCEYYIVASNWEVFDSCFSFFMEDSHPFEANIKEMFVDVRISHIDSRLIVSYWNKTRNHIWIIQITYFRRSQSRDRKVCRCLFLCELYFVKIPEFYIVKLSFNWLSNKWKWKFDFG